MSLSTLGQVLYFQLEKFKDNFIIGKQILIIKGMEKIFEEKWKKIIQKKRLFE